MVVPAGAGVLPLSTGCSPEMLLNIPQCTAGDFHPLSPPTPATKNCPAPASVVLWEIKLMQTYPFMPVFVADPAFLLLLMFRKSGGRGVCVCMFSYNWKKLRQPHRCSSELP